MFRTELEVNEGTDLTHAIADLRNRATAAGLSASSVEHVAQDAHDALEPLLRQARELAHHGSQMHARRTIAGNGYQIAVVCRTGRRKSFLATLLERIRGA